MSTPELNLKGKVALITGGTRGLGRAMAEGLAAAGANLVVASRTEDDCANAAKAFEAQGVGALPVTCDVGKWADCDTLVEKAYDHFGKVDILINNAGMSSMARRPSDLSEDDFNRVFDVNVKGPYRLSALTGERMMEGDGGVILNVSSTAAVLTPPPVAPYAAAKAGVNALTKALARAYGPKVRVNALMCGTFRTDLTKGFVDTPDFQKQIKATTPLRRVGETADVVGSALFLVSDMSEFMSGTIITLDGGQT